MKKAILIAFLLLIALSANAQDIIAVPDSDNTASFEATVQSQIQPNTLTSSTTTRLTVQKKAHPKPLTSSQSIAIEAYLKKHYDKNSQANREALRGALTFLLGINQSHLPLNRQANDYLADKQTYDQAMKHTDFYVNVPGLPAFNGGGAQGPLVLDGVPQVEKTVSASYPAQLPGAMNISHLGDRQETPIASVTRSWKQIPNRPVEKVCPPGPPPPKPPVVGPTCDPDGTPPDKPPVIGPIGDPSGPNPGGPPAPGGPPPPSGDQGPVIIGGGGVVPWNPPPTHPRVADPVNPPPPPVVTN